MVMFCRKAPVSREVQGTGRGVRPADVVAVDEGGETGMGATGEGEAPPSPMKGILAGNRLGSWEL
jgi:hypothetical protein